MTDDEKRELSHLADHIVQLSEEVARIGNRLNDIVYDLRYILTKDMYSLMEAETEYTEEQKRIRRWKEKFGGSMGHMRQPKMEEA